MRILVTGSRDWTDEKIVYDAFLERTFNVLDKHVLVHGGAAGADAIAAKFATLFGWDVEEHPANWDSCGPDCNPSHYRYRFGKPYCPRSGFVRNDKMVKLGADICLAFIKDGSKGATMAAKLAERAGIPVHRYLATTG